jgi:hypothetical protein
MKIIKYFFMFLTILNLNAENKILFLYDSKTLKKETKYIFQEITSKKENIIKIKINKKWLKRKNKNLDKLKDAIFFFNKDYNKKIDIIAIGRGAKILKELIEFCDQVHTLAIDKAIIIDKETSIHTQDLTPYSKKRTYYGKPEKPLRKFYIAKINSYTKKCELIKPKNKSSRFIENDEAISDSYEYYETEVDLPEDEMADDETFLVKTDSLQEKINLNKKMILVSSDEYLRLLEQQKTDNSCLGWCKKNWNAEHTTALLKITNTILTLLAA